MSGASLKKSTALTYKRAQLTMDCKKQILLFKTQMKTILKLLLIAVALLLPSVASADTTGSEKAISPSQLPAKARQTIAAHFPNRKIALAKMETELFSRSYSVILTHGEKIEFDGRGAWTEIKCKRSAVPAALVPQPIARYVRENYPDARIIEIEKDDDEIEVTLSNHLEVTFNKDFEVTDID